MSRPVVKLLYHPLLKGHTMTKSVLASLLLVVIVATVVAGLVLIGASVPIALLAGMVVFLSIKADDARIRRSRTRA